MSAVTCLEDTWQNPCGKAACTRSKGIVEVQTGRLDGSEIPNTSTDSIRSRIFLDGFYREKSTTTTTSKQKEFSLRM